MVNNEYFIVVSLITFKLPALYPKHVVNNDKKPKLEYWVIKSLIKPIKNPIRVAFFCPDLREMVMMINNVKSGDISIVLYSMWGKYKANRNSINNKIII